MYANLYHWHDPAEQEEEEDEEAEEEEEEEAEAEEEEEEEVDQEQAWHQLSQVERVRQDGGGDRNGTLTLPSLANWPALGGPGGGHHGAGLGAGWGGPVHLLEAAAWGGDGDRLCLCTASFPGNCTSSVEQTILEKSHEGGHQGNQWLRWIKK